MVTNMGIATHRSRTARIAMTLCSYGRSTMRRSCKQVCPTRAASSAVLQLLQVPRPLCHKKLCTGRSHVTRCWQ